MQGAAKGRPDLELNCPHFELWTLFKWFPS